MNHSARKYVIQTNNPLKVQPVIAEAIGLEPAIVLQELVWLLRAPNNGKEINGVRWIYNTYSEWKQNYFLWMSERTLQRIFLLLENEK